LPLPNFIKGTLEDAIHSASWRKRPLLIFMDDLDNEKEVSEEFLKNTIANDEALQMLVLLPNKHRRRILW